MALYAGSYGRQAPLRSTQGEIRPMIDLPLSNKQAYALYDVLRYVCQQGKLSPEEPLEQVRVKLRKLGAEAMCQECCERPAERNQRCQRCEMRRRRAS